ncbi:P-loop ATPase, Sll1717 family [Methylobacterium oxalidis]|uniref:Uncharacterized protein n=1 Tax=Methylobacterium oxalidis TaxID=944322 RepID=A0A512JCG1_9HYPH|nr:hypothetical protein [Methylobacterium oxalidis]GEP07607.1 hypothetical protein MOX02_56450 [Methylobacterium oxalidis]GJE33461.1 hypothetical protein LDDCCGHA_3661 [Methylobacterium oxalidis]GLS66191.1 hypothetical protein GCM10007888_45730 [Methylobacterium oxalidis]
MPAVKELLRRLDLGNSVAEFDEQLEEYFVETETFRSLINNRSDIIAGDKGTGKTAAFRILSKRYAKIPELRNVEVLTAFNPQGNPIFTQLGEKGPLEEAEYVRLWKAYILSLAGNWLLDVYDGEFTAGMGELDALLRGLEAREQTAPPQNIFRRIVGKVGGLFAWKSAETQVAISPEGSYTFGPKVDMATGEKRNDASIPVEVALRKLDESLREANLTLWIALDRLDEAFHGFKEVEIPALRGLFRAYLDLLEFNNFRLKLFVRRDLFRRVTEGGFVNLTHINARKFEIIWDEEDLLNLLCRRIRKNNDFCSSAEINDVSDQEIFDKLFPDQVDQGTRKPKTWTWAMRRIRDGNDIKPPRNLIDLIEMAKLAQLRTEERETRQYSSDSPIIEAESLRRALKQLSEQRVNDTLLAEAGQLSPIIEKFRGGKAEHNDASLSIALSTPIGDLRSIVKPLQEIGFLEAVKGNYKVPTLYREGLEITQGKAFPDQGKAAAEDED